jgi:hypothetical protein
MFICLEAQGLVAFIREDVRAPLEVDGFNMSTSAILFKVISWKNESS